jgi:hypothetical protein
MDLLWKLVLNWRKLHLVMWSGVVGSHDSVDGEYRYLTHEVLG